MIFYLGTHIVTWLRQVNFPLFVSHRRLRQYRTLPRAAVPWALDSGGFTELNMHGRWMSAPGQYAEAIDRYAADIGRLTWAAPQDWMCEPVVRAQTGLSVDVHQELTIASVLTLRSLVGSGTPVIPVLQGWELADYPRHVERYARAGLDLTLEPVVGLGSVCRRQHTNEIDALVRDLSSAGLRLHGFGVKTQGLRLFGDLLASADSLAWSMAARRDGQKSAGRSWCGSTGHKNCANCLAYASAWRANLVDTEGSLRWCAY